MKIINYIFPISCVVAMAFCLRHATIDGFSNILSLIAKENTVYSIGYSDEKWGKIDLGMRCNNEAIVALGGPLSERTLDDLDRALYYSMSPTDANYRIRILIFRNSCLIIKKSEFYLD